MINLLDPFGILEAIMLAKSSKPITPVQASNALSELFKPESEEERQASQVQRYRAREVVRPTRWP